MKVKRPQPLRISAKNAREKLWSESEEIFNRYLLVRDQPPRLYHYCDMKAMNSIVSTGQMWVTDALTMEDQSEIIYGHEIAAGIIAERKEDDSPFYPFDRIDTTKTRDVFRQWCTHIGCFSSSLEISHQWQKYADGGRGVALGFETIALQQWCQSRKIPLFQLLYDRTKQEKLLREFLHLATKIGHRLKPKKEEVDAYIHSATIRLSTFIMWLKSPDYSCEAEWRVLAIQKKAGGAYRRVRHPAGRCCFELPLCNPETLREVVIGPENSENESVVRNLLTSSGFHDVLVRRAPCPSGSE